VLIEVPVSENTEAFWEQTYASKSDHLLSWTQSKPELSLELIHTFGRRPGSVIDVGGGSSALAAWLIDSGTPSCIVLDISPTALERARSQVDPDVRNRIEWRVADILTGEDLPEVDVWHDRAVFHFLVNPGERAAYVAQAKRTVAPGGILIVGTLALNGPALCSGLPVQRYDAEPLAAEFAPSFDVRDVRYELHRTPWGATQRFIYLVMECRR